MSKREMADMLFLSVRTIGNHINHVYAKLGIGSREELRVVQQASTAKDTSRLQTALQRLNEAWSPLQAAAARPPG